jgi:hypothetical protein
MNFTFDEMFAMDAVELGMTLVDLQNHFDAEDDNGENNDVVINIDIENDWNVNHYGQWYFPYTVNGIRCVLWDTVTEFVLEYGTHVYNVTQNADVYDRGVYVGSLTVGGYIRTEQA